MRPALALDELALVTRTLLHMRTTFAPGEIFAGDVAHVAGLSGGGQGEDADGASPSLATVLELVRCVLRRRSQRLGGRCVCVCVCVCVCMCVYVCVCLCV